MKAMVCEAFGGPEVLALRDLPDPPPPGPGELQVRIGARGVQYVDVLMLAGKYQFRPEPPFIPGGEAAGVVTAVGTGVADFNVGDQVMSRHTLGACAELGNAKAALCDKVPAGMSIEHAGVFRGAYATAYHALLQRGRMVAGEWVLVHGAAGGIGIDAIGVRIGGLSEANPALALANMKALVELAAQGKLKPRISHRFRLDQAAQALRAVIDRAVIGKAVLVG